MASRINYEIGFSADTSALNAALKQIQTDLSKISMGKMSGVTATTSEINEAAEAAARLGSALKNAINADTGKLDLSKFSNQLNKSGLTLDQYRQKLNLIGSSGTEAFMNVAKAITQAQLPLARSSKLFDSIWVAMRNATRWQLSSSAIHGFVGGLETCYGYAQDLNTSLNNIRIVTGQSTDQMADFARQANEAAKALSSTTTSYTDAALIYYQQGFTDQQDIEQRTNTTIKLANVTRDSAKEVSDQMTAIWNNFYDGSKSLEYYADVITALGSETASSSSEISTGLEKFAAVASSVGLSYEYATSALATVTAETRQSAEVVGNAFKTLFARVQGLNLGETLDDGTTLNKYSEALNKVGINIKDQNGELKQMDTILDEMGSKWKNLEKDERLALAQTVAGVRQYNQLVALMDSWDIMEKNLRTARGSSGTLQEQADIYAESWEAARERVRAAAEDVYSSLINEDFFTDLDNSIASVLERVDDVIDAMGGFKGVLITVGTLMTSIYGDKMAQGIRNIVYNTSYLLGIEQARAIELKKVAAEQMQQVANDLASRELMAMTDIYTRQAEAQIRLNESSKQLTSYQQEQLQQEVQLLNITTQIATKYGESAMEARERLEILQETVAQENKFIDDDHFRENRRRYIRDQGGGERGERLANIALGQAKRAAGIDGYITEANIYKLVGAYSALREEMSRIGTLNRDLKNAKEADNAETEEGIIKIQALQQRLQDLVPEGKTAEEQIASLNNETRDIFTVLTQFIGLTKEGEQALAEMGKSARQAGIDGEKLISSQELQTIAAGKLDKKLEELTHATGDYASQIINVVNTIGKGLMIFNALQGIGRVFSDEDMSAAERFTTILTSLSMIIPTVVSLMDDLSKTSGMQAISKAIAEATKAGSDGVVVIKKGLMAKAASNVANKILAGSEKAVASTAREVAAAIGAQLTMLAPYILGITAAVVVIYQLVKAHNADADAAKKAAEATRETAEAAEEAKSAADELRSSIDAYDSAVEKLNECTKGTQEWRDALEEVNEAAIEVLNNAGRLSVEDLSNLRNDDGTLNRDALADLQERADERANNFSYASATVNKYAADMQMRADAISLARSINNGRRDEEDRDILLANYQELAELSKDELAPALRDLGFQISDSDSIIDTWYDSIQSMADNAEAAGEKFNLISQMEVEEALGIPDADDTFGRAVNTIVTDKLDTLAQQLTAEWEEKLTGEDINITSGVDNAIYREALRALQDAGYDVSQQTNNAVRGTDDNRSLAFLNSQGEEVVYNSEQIAAMIAAAEALEELSGSAEKATEVLNNLEDNAPEFEADAWKEFINQGNFNEMTASQASDKATMTDEELTNWIAQSYGLPDPRSNDFEAAFADLATNLGYDSGEALLAGVRDGLEISVEAAQNMGASLSEKARSIFDDINLDDIKISNQKEIEATFGQVYDRFGAEGAQKFADAISGVPEEFMNIMSEIDWQQADIDSLKAQVEALGGSLEGVTDDQLATMIEMMQVIEEIDLDSAMETFKNIKDIIDDLGGNTDAISEKQMQTLQNAGLAADAYFQKMADGTYQLKMDADEFAQLAHDVSLRDLSVVATNAQDRAVDLARLAEYNDAMLEVNTSLQREALEATGSLSAGQISDLDAIREAEGYDAYAEQIKQAFEDANISAESIEEALTKAADEANTAQQAIKDADFQFETESAGLDLDETSRYAERLAKDMAEANGETDLSTKILKKYEKAARDAAINNQKLDRGLKNLNENLDDYKKKLNNVNKGTAEWSETMDALKGDLADIVGFDDADLLSDEFAENILASNDLQLALDGDVEAIQRLQTAAADDVIINIVANQSETPDQIRTMWEQLKLDFAEMGDLTAPGIDQTELINSFNNLIQAGKMTKDQIEAALAGLHVSANVKTEYIPQTVSVPQTITEEAMLPGGTATVQVPGEDGRWENQTVYLKKKVTRTYDAGTVDVQGVIPKYTIEGTEGEGRVTTAFVPAPPPKVSKSSTRSGGAGSKKSGGGSSKKEDKPKKRDTTDLGDILDRYHEINDQLDDIVRTINKLDKATDRLYGTKKFANMDKETARLKDQVKLLEEKTKQAQNYLGTVDKDNLVIAAKRVGFNLTDNSFDEAGNLLNVEEIQRSMYNKLHEMEVKYNAMATGTKQDTYNEEVVQPWQDKIDQFKKALEQYEETRELIQDLGEEHEEILREIEDIRFKRIVENIEIRLDYKDAKKDINDLAKIIREAVGTAYDWGADVAKLDFQNMEIEKSKMSEYQTEYSRLLALYEEAKENPYISEADIAEQLEELRGQIIGSAEALVEWAESLEDLLPDAIDAAREHFDQFIDQLEHNTAVIDTIKEIMVLQGLTLKTAQGFNDIQDIHRKRMDATLAEAKLNRQWYDRAAEELKQAQEALSQATVGTQQYDILKANRDALLQEFNEAQEAMLESAKETMEEARDMYVDAVERAAYELEQKLTRGQGFDLLQDKYDHYLDTEERYLDTVNRIYETTTLNNKLQKELDKTTSVAGREKLKELQEEFKLREANNKLSQYDIDIMNAKLEMTLKQMALEDAQKAKNSMRLVRDSQGNWNYQYVADQQEIEDTNQEYLDAMNEYYNLAKDRVKEVTGEIIDTWQEMAEKIKEVYENEELTVAEREARIAEIREYYTQKVKDLEEEKQKAIVDMTEAGQIAIDDFQERHSETLDKMGNDVDNLKNIFSDDLAAILSGADEFNNQFATDMDNLSQEVVDFDELFDNTITNMNNAAQEYQDNITNVNTEVGVSYDDLKGMLEEVADATDELTYRGQDEIEMMWDKITTIRELSEEYAGLADSVLEAAEAMRKLASDTAKTQYDTIAGLDDDIDYSALIAQGIMSGASEDQILALKEARLNSSHWTDHKDQSGSWLTNDQVIAAAKAYKAGTATAAQKQWVESALNYQGPLDNTKLYNQNDPNSILEYIKRRYGMATGGYTGLFDDAKLAFLHEKELVLNAEDTKNILTAVQAVRTQTPDLLTQIEKILDARVLSMISTLSSLLVSAKATPTNKEVLQQDVKIEATFPNVTDRNEIEAAFNSLVNDVSQYVHRRTE